MKNNPFERIDDVDEENRQIEEIAGLMKQLIEKRYTEAGESLRGVHPKSHGCLEAKFKISKRIKPDLQVGLFSRPGAEYDAIVRYSNADSLVRHDLKDGENGSRGMAVKILQVPGDVIYEDRGHPSQDFLLINSPQFAFANIHDYLKLQRILLRFDDDPTPFFADLQNPPPADPVALAEFLRVKQTFDVVSWIKKTPVANPLEVAYFGASPFLFGRKGVMRVSLSPIVQPEQLVPEHAGENYLRDAIMTSMAKSENIEFDFQIQVRGSGEEDLDIEDATKCWSTEDFPPATVARLTIPAPQIDRQDCEKLFFTPWHSLSAHRPLGGINRLRKAVYIASLNRRRFEDREATC